MMLKPKGWYGWLAALAVLLGAIALVALDLADGAVRRWWAAHALTTSTVSGVLVLMLTLLIVDQVVRGRQVLDRSRATCAQAAIVLSQGERSAQAVGAALACSGERATAAEEVRTYMLMLLVSAPVLIDARVSRTFLEQAQRLAGEMAHVMTTTGRGRAQAVPPGGRIEESVRQLRVAAAPLIQQLTPDERVAVGEFQS
jgi:hypothetical protein